MIRIAVLDSGLAPNRPEFPNVVPGHSFGQLKPNPLWRKGMPTREYWLLRDPSDSTDDFGHGTHVAGIIVANATVPVEILPVKISDHQGDSTPGWIEEGIVYAVNNGAQIINLSLGTNFGEYLDAAIEFAEASNVLIVAAAGNDNSSELYYPAASEFVLSVGAVSHAGTVAAFSNRGNWITCYGLGVSVESTVPTYPCHFWSKTGRCFLSGTSQAAPSIAGMAAAKVQSGMKPADIRKSFQGFRYTPLVTSPVQKGILTNVLAK